MTVSVWPRKFFHDTLFMFGITDETVESYTTNAFISIQSSKGSASNEETEEGPYFKKEHPNVLTISFDDITDKDVVTFPFAYNLKLFNENDANTIIDFIGSNVGRDFVVHCTAGISRSGAVGEFIQRICGVPWKEFLLSNPNIHPNTYVLKLLMREYNRRIGYNDIETEY